MSMPVFYSETYTVALPAAHRFPMERYARTNEVLRAALAQLPKLSVTIVEPPPATEADVMLAHTPAFVAAYCGNTLPEAAHKKIGFPCSLDFVRRTMMITGGTIAATVSALTTCRRRLPSFEAESQPSILSTNHTSSRGGSTMGAAALPSGDQHLGSSARQSTPPHSRQQHSVWVGPGGVACNQAGGTHHAFADAGEGFCIFNDIAVAARWVLGPGSSAGGVNSMLPANSHGQPTSLQQPWTHSGSTTVPSTAADLETQPPRHPFAWPETADLGIRRVLVLDLDVHQGNGTAAIFSEDPRVTTVSMHGARNYPWSSRHPSTLDVDVPDGAGDEEYLLLLQDMLSRVDELIGWRGARNASAGPNAGSSHRSAKADATAAASPLAASSDLLVFYQAGVDPLMHDRLGRLKLTRTGLQERNAAVLRWCEERSLPLVVTMGGGYSRPIELSARCHADVFIQAAGSFVRRAESFRRAEW